MTAKGLVIRGVALVLALLSSLAAAARSLGAEEISSTLPDGARWGLSVVDLSSGSERGMGSAQDQPLVPGSLVKLVTTGALLELASENGAPPDLSTGVSRDGEIVDGVLKGNLYLTGRGNALLTTAELRTAAERVRGLGVSRVAGEVVLDVTSLESAGLERSRVGPSQAEAGALGCDLHTVAMAITPGAAGSPPQVTVEPPNDEVRLAVTVRTVAIPGQPLSVTRFGDLSFGVTGSLQPGGEGVRKRFPLHDPATFAGGVFRTLLAREGVTVDGAVRKGKEPAAAAVVATIDPPDFDRLLREMNVHSLNVVADNLFLVLGRERYKAPGTAAKGARAVELHLKEIGAEGMVVADGSGLHRDDRMTTRGLARYLAAVSKKPWFERLLATLPRAGMEGTLQDLGFTDQRFRAKTGALEDCYSLAGYGVDGRGREIAFAFIVNSPGAGIMDLRKAGATVMRYLSTEGSL